MRKNTRLYPLFGQWIGETMKRIGINHREMFTVAGMGGGTLNDILQGK